MFNAISFKKRKLWTEFTATAQMGLMLTKFKKEDGYAARRPNCELTKDLLTPTPPRRWRRRTGVQLKTWVTTIKADLEPLSGPRVFGYARWRKDWVKVSRELVQDRRTWGVSVRGGNSACPRLIPLFMLDRWRLKLAGKWIIRFQGVTVLAGQISARCTSIRL